MNNLFPVEGKYYVTVWTLIIVVNDNIKRPQDEDIESNVLDQILTQHTLHARLTQLQHITFRTSNFQVYKSAYVCTSKGFVHNLQNFDFFRMVFLHDCLSVNNVENFK